MGGCCCCCAYRHNELNRSAPFLQHPVQSEDREPLSSHHGLFVNAYQDNTSVPDTYQPPPPPTPFETYVGPNHTPTTLGAEVKNLGSDKSAGIEASDEVEDARSDDEFNKTSKHANPPLRDEDDGCPICLEEYDAENPKILTECDHHFHLACILEWMERSNTCALCDQEMVIQSEVGG